MTSFFTLPPAKPLTSLLQTSVPKRPENSDVQTPVVSCAIEDIIDVDAVGSIAHSTISQCNDFSSAPSLLAERGPPHTGA